MSNLGAQMRDNPLPLLLISTGVGLMMSRSFRNEGYHGGLGMYRDDASGDLMRRSADPTAGYGNHRDAYRSRAPSQQGMMSSLREAVSTSVDSMSDMTDRAADYTNRARSGLSALATEQPLVLGALGLLAGAALAAMLPRTQVEEDYVGSAARQLRDQASSMASETYERAKSAASKAAEVASQEFSGETEKDKPQAASGGPSQSASSHAGSTAGASALGVSPAGAGGARPSETISAGSKTRV